MFNYLVIETTEVDGRGCVNAKLKREDHVVSYCLLSFVISCFFTDALDKRI